MTLDSVRTLLEGDQLYVQIIFNSWKCLYADESFVRNQEHIAMVQRISGTRTIPLVFLTPTLTSPGLVAIMFVVA